MKIAFASLAAAALVSCGGPDTQESIENGFDLANLDTTYQPCEDFFYYSSGGWQKANPVPPTEGSWGHFHQLVDRTNADLHELLNQLANSKPKAGSAEQLSGDFWYSAMDSVRANELGAAPLATYQKWVSGFAPEQFAQVVATLQLHGFPAPLSIYVGPDDKQSSVNRLQMNQGGIGLPTRDYYLQSDSGSAELQAAYKEHMSKMFALAGWTDSAQVLAEKAYRTEHALAAGMMDKVVARNPDSTYNKLTLIEVQGLAPSVSWTELFGKLGARTDTFLVAQPNYLKHLNGLLTTLPRDHWEAYFTWKIITRSAPYLSADFVAEDFNFYSKTLQGVSEMKPRWKSMVEVANGSIGFAIGKLYVEEYFEAESKQHVEEMVENLRSAFSQRIAQLEWMSDSTKAKAQAKLKAFTYKIGYPEQWEDYAGLEIKRNDLLGNVVRASRWEMQRSIAKLGKPVDRSEWYMPPQMVNAYYNPAFNEVVFPAAILQPPFYNPEADDALNYGSIGAVIGHEFSHGFDDQGSKYDGAGNLVDWWTAEDKRRFEERTARLVAQYDAFEPLPGAHVNGALTLGENIADLAGLTMAYYAYQLSREGKEMPEPIDGFTHLQRFFLGWGQIWASTTTDEALRVQLEVDYHSPGRYRAMGPVRNLVEFHEAWGCGPGDLMFLPLKQRVILW